MYVKVIKEKSNSYVKDYIGNYVAMYVALYLSNTLAL